MNQTLSVTLFSRTTISIIPLHPTHPLRSDQPSSELSRQPIAHSQSHYYDQESPNSQRLPFSRYKDHPASNPLTTALASLTSMLVPQLSTQFPSQPSKRISRLRLQARTTRPYKNHIVLPQAPQPSHSTATSPRAPVAPRPRLYLRPFRPRGIQNHPGDDKHEASPNVTGKPIVRSCGLCTPFSAPLFATVR